MKRILFGGEGGWGTVNSKIVKKRLFQKYLNVELQENKGMLKSNSFQSLGAMIENFLLPRQKKKEQEQRRKNKNMGT